MVGHYYRQPYIRGLIYIFHMPLFFFLSGLCLSTGKPQSKTIAKDAKHYLLPYVITSVFYILAAIGIAVIKHRLSVDLLIAEMLRCFWGTAADVSVGSMDILMAGPIWFLQALFWGKLFARLIIKNTKNDLNRFLVCFAVSIICAISAGYIWLPLNIQSGLFHTIYLLLGWLAKKRWGADLNGKIKFSQKSLLLVPSVVILSIAAYWYSVNQAIVVYGLLDFPLQGVDTFLAILGIILMVFLAKSLDKFSSFSRFFRKCGENSLYILCVHSVDLLYLGPLWGFGNKIFVYAIRIVVELLAAFAILKISKSYRGTEKL